MWSFPEKTLGGLVGGYWYAPPARDKAPLMAFSPDGTFLWGKTFSTPVYNEEIQWIEQNPDGSLMLLMSRSSVDAVKIGIVKTTAEGDVLWSKTYSKDGRVGTRMLRVADGYILCGSEGDLPSEALLAIKIDFDGQVVWEKSLLPTGIINSFHSLAESPDGTLYLIGGYGLDNNGLTQSILVKFASNGTFLWAKNYATSDLHSGFRDLVVLDDGTGVIGGGTLNLDGWLLHLDAQGFPRTGEYQVQVRAVKAGCIDTTAAQPLRVRSIKDQIPNAFTPNGDGLNETFLPLYFCLLVVADFRVYDRWGKLVFQTKDSEQGWDGTFEEKPAPADVYVWHIEYEAIREEGRQRFSEKGDVTLLR